MIGSRLLLLGLLVAATLAMKARFEKKKEYLNFENIIEKVNEAQKNWKAGHNKYFNGMDLETIKGLMGGLQTPQDLKLQTKQIDPLPSIPQEFFPADLWPNCESIRQIRDQSNCGSCWAFAAVEIISDRICISSGQRVQVRISAADLLSCCGWCGYGCGGGYSDVAMNYWYRKGIVTGWLYNTTGYCYPYQFAPCDHHTEGKYGPCDKSRGTPECVQKCIPGYDKAYKDDRHAAKTVYRVPSQEPKIQSQLMTYGPIEVMFTVYEDFLTYKSGVYHHTHGKKVGLHAVKMLGWGVENGTKYWLIANSWNEDWGDKGFFKIRRGIDQCGIESQGVAGIPLFE